jgi:DNA-binding winged helix-turn-helix (wHTH) protein/Tol biopolymer transport system component
MATPSRTSQRVRFGEFELDLSTRELWSNGTKQALAPQPFQVLQILIENRGQLVSHDVVVRHLWPSDTFVDYEQSLRKAVNRLREVLKDSAEAPRFIETLPRQGYRFIANLEFDTAVRDRFADAVVVMPKRVPDEPDAKITQRNPIPTIHLLWVSAVVILAVAGILAWRSRASRHASSVVPEPKTTQLIANSFENPITSSAISPDGKYLAFTDDTRRMRIRLLETGETQTIPEPESLKGNSVDWAIAAWLPDNTRFIANARQPGGFASIAGRFRLAANSRPTGLTETRISEAASIWVVSVLGKPPQKLRDDANAFSVSLDGSSIAFGTNPGPLGDREIWLMDAKGLQARKLYDAPEKTAIGDLQWSGDGQRAIYLEVTAENGRLVSRDLRGGPAIPLVQYSYSGWNLTDFVSLPDGRVMYVRGSNFWELRMDPRNGGRAGEPRQVTDWSGLWLGLTSATSDGKRLVFQRSTPQTTVNVADIEANGTHLSPARHLTLNEYSNAAETWTPDSRAVVFRSRRNGNGRLFRQALNSDIEEPLVMGAERVGGSAISPDGAWLFYFQFLQCEAQPASCETVFPLMRIPIHGGEPRQVLVLTTEPYSRPRCTFAPADLCAIVEQSADGKPLIFTAFDALKGRGAEIARFETEPGGYYSWGLSPDGTRIAIVKEGDNQIHIVSLKSDAPQEVAVKHWTNLDGVIFWAADGKGWFISSRSEMSDVLLHVDLQGDAHPLWSSNGRGSKVQALPSPDGRHLAIVATACNNNVWMMENF